jgi:hypothetical protein
MVCARTVVFVHTLLYSNKHVQAAVVQLCFSSGLTAAAYTACRLQLECVHMQLWRSKIYANTNYWVTIWIRLVASSPLDCTGLQCSHCCLRSSASFMIVCHQSLQIDKSLSITEASGCMQAQHCNAAAVRYQAHSKLS